MKRGRYFLEKVECVCRRRRRLAARRIAPRKVDERHSASRSHANENLTPASLAGPQPERVKNVVVSFHDPIAHYPNSARPNLNERGPEWLPWIGVSAGPIISK